MRIKHFAGYGCVDAKKLSRFKVSTGDTVLKVRVTGNHECGLLRNDPYDLKWWLIERFDKAAKNIDPYTIAYEYNYDFDYETNKDVCDYTFVY